MITPKLSYLGQPLIFSFSPVGDRGSSLGFFDFFSGVAGVAVAAAVFSLLSKSFKMAPASANTLNGFMIIKAVTAKSDICGLTGGRGGLAARDLAGFFVPLS